MPPAQLPTETVTAYASDGTRLSVYLDAPARPRPDAATVVLVHGASVTADLWRAHTRHLTDRGFRVLRYDQRAHGHSLRGEAPLSVEQLTDDLDRVVSACAPAGPLVLVGHSLGALLLQDLVARRPALLSRVRGMVLLSATARRASVLSGLRPRALLAAAGRGLASLAFAHAPSAVDWARRRLPPTHRYALTPRPEAEPVGGPPLCRHGVRHTRTADLNTLWQALHRYQPHDLRALERLGSRVLLMAGSGDRHIPAADTAHLASLLPDARLEIVPRATHALPIRHPELVSARIAALAAHDTEPTRGTSADNFGLAS
ncbi:alpha/beta fold hydrolase [Streptomyces fragilis]|uniref:Alpha/beta hydrolase n=1 Tax=Streptomyces fragilis TaxID=67301 RepID=A0ABV2YCE2_9ACTN|nr:alpha/beta hydrolase [Streptomyces fragilis]